MSGCMPVSNMQAVKDVKYDDLTVVVLLYTVITSFSGQGSSGVSTEKKAE